MLPEYVTETSLTTHIKGVTNQITSLATSVNRALDRMEDFEKRITATEIDVATINKGINNGKEYGNKRSTGRRWLITTIITVSAVVVAGAAVWVALAK